MEPQYTLSLIQRMLEMGYPALAGLPMAISADLARVAKSIRKPRRMSLSPVETGELETASNR
ncbi:MAG: hypothetical protein ACLPND_01830 [Candidatus Korobacteraceae bacterium]